MAANRASRHQVTARQLGELSLAAPQVITHRLMRLWLSGPVLSERDRTEFTAMVLEKQLAFSQSWFAMWAETVRIQQSLLWPCFGAPATGVTNPLAMALEMAAQYNDSVHRVFSKGLAPVHRKALSNAQRLGRTPVRGAI
jgi:hypothetical protein